MRVHTTVRINKEVRNSPFKQRARIAVRAVRKAAIRLFGENGKDCRIDPKLNQAIWRNGVRYVPDRLRVQLTKDEDGISAQVVEVAQFNSLTTEVVEA